jgi:SGF29 tudor-like domain
MDPTIPTVDPIQRTGKRAAPAAAAPAALPTVAVLPPAPPVPLTFSQLKSPPTGSSSLLGRPMASRPLPLQRPSIKASSASSSSMTTTTTTTINHKDAAAAAASTTESSSSAAAPNSNNANGSSSSAAADGSTLRRHRKKKLSPSGEPPIDLPELDQVTKRRLCSKKEHGARMAKVLRFRPLRQGDPVAARTSSRDVWILAQVLHDYSGPPTAMAPFEFLRLTDSRRDQIYREKVVVADIEDESKTPIRVGRNLCLPLPRSPYEAAEWCSRYLKKGSRVYAMYPQTTALYTVRLCCVVTGARRQLTNQRLSTVF